MTVARLQQAIVLGLVAAVCTCGVYGAGSVHRDWAVWGAGLLLGIHPAALALEFWFQARIDRNDGALRPGWSERYAAWCREVKHSTIVFGWRQPFRSRRYPASRLDIVPACRGVVLIHGFFCNRGIWNRWIPELQRHGVPYVALNLEPAFGSISDYAPAIEDAVRQLEQLTGLAPILVGHSMGGLAGRYWRAGQNVDRHHHLLTIATPHRGTWVAGLSQSTNARQMRIDSSWLAHLRAREKPSLSANTTCFHSRCDNVVIPAANATLPGADNRHLPGVAHVMMIDRPEPLAEALRLASIRP